MSKAARAFLRRLGLACGIAAALLALPAGADRLPLIGVNQVGLSWMRAAERQAIFEHMQQRGVKLVRVPLHAPFPGVLDAIEEMRARDFDVVLVISLNQQQFFDANAQTRSGFGRVETSYRLSDIQPARFQESFGKIWAELERRKLRLAAIEVGNEINWTFNGDIPVRPDRGTGGVQRDPASQPWGAAFQRGLDRYIELVAAVKALRDQSVVNRGTTILAAGMARIRPEFAASVGSDAVEPAALMQLLAARGLDRLADARAMHFYPQPRASVEERQRALDEALSDCVIGAASRGCWLTEWGISTVSSSCPLDDSARQGLVAETRRGIDKAAAEGRLAAAIYFEWEGKSPRSVWRCGALTPAGELAISAPR